jgi:hypothetical protein
MQQQPQDAFTLFHLIIAFGGFTLCNIIAMAKLWGKMQQVITDNSQRLCDIEDRLDPKDSENRFLTVKDCAGRQNTIVAHVVEVKTMITLMDTRADARMTRIEARREETNRLICDLAVRVGAAQSTERAG